ncbi:MAG: DUF3737 family protein [Lachnospiraceae bacterium]|nr:DUF3737 family protein [Lachnospiraceae bacterium]MBO7340012.1 DUF3737 family protein [Lachnospiraceae bacterium]MBP5263696.1 DUF3737 family protein [Lachnospiraceae bacterium]MBP5732786.1 DUF3737 family protein [Lachnospiraceae bacterium]
MGEKKEIRQEFLTGERALFMSRDLRVVDCTFADGESPLKESENIELEGSMFKWKYPLWYCKNVTAKDCVWFDMARAGVWYTDNVTLENTPIDAPKNFRRCKGVTLRNVSFSNAEETLWSCDDVELTHVVARGNYFGMNSTNVTVKDLTLYGNYSFDGARNVTVEGSKLLSKDSFWNCENVVVRDSYISGEYLGWNSKNLTFENCTIESLQGMCYIENLVMKNCKLLNTTLAFEYSTVEADITSKIDSVLNPTSGTITADAIGELILEKDKIDPSKTKITCREAQV